MTNYFFDVLPADLQQFIYHKNLINSLNNLNQEKSFGFEFQPKYRDVWINVLFTGEYHNMHLQNGYFLDFSQAIAEDWDYVESGDKIYADVMWHKHWHQVLLFDDTAYYDYDYFYTNP